MAISTGQVEAVPAFSRSLASLSLALSLALWRPPSRSDSLRAPTMRLAGSFPLSLVGFEWLSLEARLRAQQWAAEIC